LGCADVEGSSALWHNADSKRAASAPNGLMSVLFVRLLRAQVVGPLKGWSVPSVARARFALSMCAVPCLNSMMFIWILMQSTWSAPATLPQYDSLAGRGVQGHEVG
jgi:hypothetical protein